jgi:hypothetical protein
MHRVACRRRRLGIPAANPRRRIDWQPVDPHLGKHPDRVVAEHFGLRAQRVELRRRQLGIAPHQNDRATVLRDEGLKRLLRRPNSEITGVSKRTVWKMRKELRIPPPPADSPWTPEVLARLGEVPDEVLARDLGLQPETVRMKRCELGRYLRQPPRRWTEEELEILRQTPDDREAARRLGRTPRAVHHKRLELQKER